MSTGVSRRTTRERAYAAFVEGLELRALWLARLQLENRCGPREPMDGRIEISGEVRFERTGDGFRVFHSYRAAFLSRRA